MNFAQSVLEWIINNLLTDSQLDVHVFGCKHPLRSWLDKDKFRKDQEILEAKIELAEAVLELVAATEASATERDPIRVALNRAIEAANHKHRCQQRLIALLHSA